MKICRSDAILPETMLKYEYNKKVCNSKIERKKAFNRSDSSKTIDLLFDKMFKIAKAKENKDIDIWKIRDDGKIIRKSEDIIVDKRSNK